MIKILFFGGSGGSWDFIFFGGGGASTPQIP